MLLAAAGGVACGLLAPGVASSLGIVTDIFLRLIRAIVAPVLVGVLIRAVGSAGSLGDLGRLGWKSLLLFELFTTVALLLGWGAALLFEPGRGVALASAAAPTVNAWSLRDLVVNAFPTSIFDAMARGDVLQILVFCLLFGLACLSAGEKARPVLDLAEAVVAVAFRFTHLVMFLAPLAVFAALAGTLGVAGVPLRRFLRAVREPFLIAFATTSSAAALPQTLENLERFGVPRRILGVVAPLSVSLNLCGSTLFLGLATLFIAQAAGIALSVEQQLLILVTLKLTSKGVAGIPRANLVVLAALFQSFGLPPEGLGLLLAIDAFIDPIRTSVNVVGHCTAPVVVARWEGTRFPAQPTGQAVNR
jgi:proton glutamate symport protein